MAQVLQRRGHHGGEVFERQRGGLQAPKQRIVIADFGADSAAKNRRDRAPDGDGAARSDSVGVVPGDVRDSSSSSLLMAANTCRTWHGLAVPWFSWVLTRGSPALGGAIHPV